MKFCSNDSRPTTPSIRRMARANSSALSWLRFMGCRFHFSLGKMHGKYMHGKYMHGKYMQGEGG